MSQKKWLRTLKERKVEVLVGIGRVESLWDTPGRVERACAHWALHRKTFYEEITLRHS